MAVVLSVLDVQRHVARGTRAYRRGHGTPRRAAAAADPFPLPPPSLPRLHLLRHPCFTHSLPYSSFLLPLNLSRSSHHISQRKITASCKSRIVPNTLGPMTSKVGEDASHGSRRAVAPVRASTAVNPAAYRLWASCSHPCVARGSRVLFGVRRQLAGARLTQGGAHHRLPPQQQTRSRSTLINIHTSANCKLE